MMVWPWNAIISYSRTALILSLFRRTHEADLPRKSLKSLLLQYHCITIMSWELVVRWEKLTRRGNNRSVRVQQLVLLVWRLKSQRCKLRGLERTSKINRQGRTYQPFEKVVTWPIIPNTIQGDRTLYGQKWWVESGGGTKMKQHG